MIFYIHLASRKGYGILLYRHTDREVKKKKMNRKRVSFFATGIVCAYFTIALFGVRVFVLPPEDGGMMSCPLTGSAGSLCTAGIFDKINHWNTLFATIIAPLVVFFALFSLSQWRSRKILELSTEHKQKIRLVQNSPNIRLFEPFVRLFSDGILNRRVYDA